MRLVALLTMLTACTPEEDCAPIPDVDAEFAQLVRDATPYLRPSERCATEPHQVTFVADSADMPKACWRTARVLGCNTMYLDETPRVWVLDCQGDPVTTVRHERLHTLLECEDPWGGGDPDHELPIWDELEVR